MRLLLLSLCLGLVTLNAFSQSKLQGAGKATKVGASTATKTPTTSTKSTTKKPSTSSSQVKKAPSNSSKYAAKGYMEISDISFANTDTDNTIIDNYDSKLYAKEVKYLKPRISYKGLSNEEITLNIKQIDEDGKL